MSEPTKRLEKRQGIQHRGKVTPETPPNSFKSILQYEVESGESLIDQSKVAIETDVFLLADGNVVLLHPADAGIAFDQLAEIESLTLDELTAKLRLPEASIPTIEDYIRQGMDRGLEFYLDIKGANVESSVRAAKAIVQKIHELRQQGLFKWRAGMQEGSQEYIQTYAEKHLQVQCLAIEALQAAQEEMDRLQEPLIKNLAWVANPQFAPRYVDLVDGSIEQVRQMLGDSATREMVMDLPLNDWFRYGVDLAERLGFKSLGTDKAAILAAAMRSEAEARELIAYAHSKGVGVTLSVVKGEAEAKQLLDLGVDKLMFEPIEKD